MITEDYSGPITQPNIVKKSSKFAKESLKHPTRGAQTGNLNTGDDGFLLKKLQEIYLMLRDQIVKHVGTPKNLTINRALFRAV
jgi:hypothetical protein